MWTANIVKVWSEKLILRKIDFINNYCIIIHIIDYGHQRNLSNNTELYG